MADDSESLVLSISADVRQVKRALDRLVADTKIAGKEIEGALTGSGAAANSAVANIKKVDSAMAASARRMQGFASTIRSGLGSFGIGFGAGFAVQQVTALVDANTRITNSLKVAGLEGKNLQGVYDQLAGSATKFGAPFEALAKVYSRVAIVQNELGVSTQQLVKFTDNVAAALKVQGISAQDAQGPLLQLSQLLSTGKVRAEEFNSVNEGMPVILKTVARGMGDTGGSIATLRQKMLAQNLTSKEFFDAFERGSKVLQEQASKASFTFGQSMENLQTALVQAAGKFDAATGASSGFAKSVTGTIAIVEKLNAALVAGTGVSLTDATVAGLENAFPLLTAQLAIVKQINDELEKNAALAAKQAAGPREQFRQQREQNVSAAEAVNRQAVDKTAVAYAKLFDQVETLRRGFDDLAHAEEDAGKQGSSDRIAASFADLETKLTNGTVTTKELNDAIAALRDTGTDAGTKMADALQGFIDKFHDTAEAIKEPDAAVQKLAETVSKSLGSALDSILEKLTAWSTPLTEFIKLLGTAIQQTNTLEGSTLAVNQQLSQHPGFALTVGGGGAGLGGVPPDLQVDAFNEALGSAAGEIDKFVENVIRAESGGSATAKNPRSSATGAGQFIDSTWLSVFKRHFAAEAKGMSDSAILGLRTNAEASRRMIRAYASDNAKILLAAGQQVTEANLQLAHFLGAGGATAVLKAAPGTRVADIPGMAGAVAANPEVLGGGATREDVLAYADRRASGGGRKKKEADDLDQWIAKSKEAIALKEKENEIDKDITGTIDEKTAAKEREKLIQEGLAAATAQYGTVTDEQKQKIIELADAQAKLGLAAAQTADQQQKAADAAKEQSAAAEQFAQQIGSIASSAISGFISDLRAGKDAGEAFVNMLNKITDSLIDMALQSVFSADNMKALFSGIGGGGGGGGGGGIGSFFSSLFGGGGAAAAMGPLNFIGPWGAAMEKGGLVGDPRLPQHPVNPRHFRHAKSYALGGFPGKPPGSIPIYAHPGEVIIPKNMVGGAGRQGGGANVDNSLTNNLGPVSIDMAGSGVVAAGPQQAKQFGENMRAMIAQEMVRESRPGGLLRPGPGSAMR